MSKIKYQNLGIKTRIKKYFKGDDIYNFEELMKNFSKKYNIIKPIIKGIVLDFDSFNIILGSGECDIKTYLLALDYFNSNVIVSRRLDKKRYDVLEVFDNAPFIVRSGYENLKQNIKVEKIYTKREKENYSYSINGITFLEYMYYYINSNIECRIVLKFNNSIFFQDNTFMIKLFESKDINTIDDLYKKIIEIIANPEIEIRIVKDLNKEFPEIIIVKSGKLVEYKRLIKENDEEKYIDYHDDTLFITKKEDPNNNNYIKEFKKTIYKK